MQSSRLVDGRDFFVQLGKRLLEHLRVARVLARCELMRPLGARELQVSLFDDVLDLVGRVFTGFKVTCSFSSI